MIKTAAKHLKNSQKNALRSMVAFVVSEALNKAFEKELNTVEKVKTLVLMGATADKIETAVRACPGFENSGLRIIKADNMQDAVFKARKEAIYGDVVSLSPASASFDKYPNFEARGKHYKEIVNRLV